MRHYLLVVPFEHARLFEPVTFVELFGRIVGDLDMEIYVLNFGLAVSRCSFEYVLQGMRPKTSGPIRLRRAKLNGTVDWKERVLLTANTPIVIRYSLVLPSTVSNLQQMVPTGTSL